jgi:predicted esterase
VRHWPVVLVLFGCTESGRRAPVHEAAPPPPAAVVPARPVATPVSVPDAAVSRPWPANPAPAVETDWCIELVSALDEETCFVLPDAPTRELLVYLHGIVPPTKESVQKTNFETVVANAARRAGVAALIPRGDQGLAPKQYDRWWGWPTSSGPSYQRLAPKLLDRIADKRRKLEHLAGVEFERVYVAGSSSGAYFAAAIALNGGIADAAGFGAMSGGAGARTPVLASLAPKPFYVGFGKHDTVAGSARALASLLREAGWPVRVAEHPVGHGAKEIYLDEAFAFWREQAE